MVMGLKMVNALSVRDFGDQMPGNGAFVPVGGERFHRLAGCSLAARTGAGGRGFEFRVAPARTFDISPLSWSMNYSAIIRKSSSISWRHNRFSVLTAELELNEFIAALSTSPSSPTSDKKMTERSYSRANGSET